MGGSLPARTAPPTPGPPEVGEALWSVFRAIWIAGQRDCRAIRLTMPQARVLFALDLADPVSPSALATRLELSRQAMSSAMLHLEREGLVRREHSTSDRRTVQVRFTPKGRRRLGRLFARQHRLHQRMGRLFSARDGRRLVGELTRIATEVAGDSAAPAYRCPACAAARRATRSRP
jgi:DNA-binding MarR family transcriptional regulator